MKILHIIDTGGFGGAEKYILDLIMKLKKMYVVDIKILIFNENKIFMETANSHNIDINCIANLNKKRTDINAIRQITAIKDIYLNQKYDIIHTHGYRANILTRLALFFTDAKIITTVHSTMNYWDSIIKKKLYGSLDQITSCRNQVIICVSKFIENYYSNCLNKNRIKVIYNGVDNTVFIPKTKKNSGELITIINVGSLTDVKNQVTLVKAIDYLVNIYLIKKVRLKIIGDGPNKDRIAELIRMLRLERVIDLIGFNTNIVKYLFESDIYVSTSSEESFGLSIVEAMMVGLPVIAPKVGGIPEIITDKIDGILYSNCYDYKTLANEIMQLIINEEKRIIIGAAGQKKCIEKFTLDKLCNDVWDIYNNIIR
jgi:glycosyltransferase involved in cell wall biosynthesis